ncbi:MAG: hypothetical protein QOI16_966, partial [Pseudonocardiales bacterium]|nr:hypothetical protein [Pseudonocardiales bacterium]
APYAGGITTLETSFSSGGDWCIGVAEWHVTTLRRGANSDA